MKKTTLLFKVGMLAIAALIISMCVPPGAGADDAAAQARRDSLKNVRCPRLMSSAAEYYHARDWDATVRVYSEVVELGCDDWDTTFAPPEEIYQYYGIAYEQMGKYDSSEYVLLQGVEKIPNNIDLRIRLAYAYKRQGKTDQEIVEYERILDELDPSNVRVMTELADLYRREGRYEEQKNVLKKLLAIDPSNEGAIADLAEALNALGEDPLAIYQEQYDNNPTASNAIQLANVLMDNNRFDEAIKVLTTASRRESDNKMVFRKLGDAYIQNGEFGKAADALENLYDLDPRDYGTAVRIAEAKTETGDFGDAIRWADRAIKKSNLAGEPLGAKGNVYYAAFHKCRTPEVSTDDRIVARLAYNYFSQAEKKGFRNFSDSRRWLKDNEVIFGKSDWFMQTASQKAAGYTKPKTSCYNWVTERLYKDPSW